MAKHVIALASELGPGQRKVVSISGRDIVVFNTNGEYFAILNRCPHLGGDLGKGFLCGLVESPKAGEYKYSRQGEVIRCPWHGWEFDLRTGKSWCDPNRVRVKNYAVAVEAGRTLVEGPYVAETFPVTLEDNYIVLDA